VLPNIVNGKQVFTCDYCKTSNFARDELRCISCGAPLDITKVVTTTITGGKGNTKLIHFG